ncbi:MAG: c-type cytochrome, partial [Bacteroidota bacterium]
GEMTQITEENKLRRQLEDFHGAPNAAAVATVWPHLNHVDRHIRYAARLALEHQPLSAWKEKALSEKNPVALTNALIGLIRSATDQDKALIIDALFNINYATLSASQQLDLLRAYELVFARFGMPVAAQKKNLIALFDAQYPASTNDFNKALSKLLVFLEAPSVLPKTLALMDKKEQNNPNDELAMSSEDLILRNPQYGLDIAKMLEKMPEPQQTYLAITLSKAEKGWNPEMREKYFAWYRKAFSYRGGNSYIGFIDKARNFALKNLSKGKRKYYDELSGGDLLTDSGNDLERSDYPKGPGKNYQIKDIDTLFASALKDRNFKTGKSMYIATTCIRCHAIKGEGGNVGPDLTQIGTRFSTKDIMEAILLPSKTISDQYATTEFQLKNGKSMVGKITNQDEENYYIAQNPYVADILVKVPKKNVLSKNYSSVSSMLPGMVNSLNAEELRDLVAYLTSGGDENHAVYKSK